MSQRLLRTLFGDPIETLEDRGDELRLGGFHREAAYCYGQALARLATRGGAADAQQLLRRQKLERKRAESRSAAFRRIIEDAESLESRGRRREALALLAEAETFAEDPEELSVAKARRVRLERPPAAANVPVGASAPPSPDHEDLDSRIARLRGEIEGQPESAQAHELLGESYRSAGRYEEARAEFEAAYRRNPERLRLVIEAARITREALGDLAGAIRQLDAACQRHRPTSESLGLHCERLLWLAEAGRADEAIAGFSDLLSGTGFDRGLLYFNRAGIEEQRGRPEAAWSDLEAAVAAAPDNLLYRERLADLALKLRSHLPEALRALEDALALDAHDFARPRRAGWSAGPLEADRARLQFKAARLLYLLNRDREARARVEEALVICRDPRVEEALLELRRSLGC